MKIHMMLISVVLIGVVVYGWGSMLSNAVEKDYITSYDNESTLQVFINNSNDGQDVARDSRGEISAIPGQGAEQDLFSTILTRGSGALNNVGGAFSVLSAMAGESVRRLPIGSMGAYLTDAVVAILMIVIFIGLILAAVLGQRDRI